MEGPRDSGSVNEAGPCRYVLYWQPLADELAEEYLSAATSGEESATGARAALTPEELGGPFVVTSAQTEFGAAVNETSPPGGDREAVPTPGGETGSAEIVRSLVQKQG